MKKIKSISTVFLSVALSISAYSQYPVNQTIQLTTTIQPGKPSITFSWDTIHGALKFNVYRKAKTANSWGKVIATLVATSTGYTDTNVVTGGDYEYKFYEIGSDTATTYVYAGIEVPVTEARGKMILLVDSTMIDSLHDELWHLQMDLIGDGWTVIRQNVSRNATSLSVKKIIRNIYYSDTVNVKSVFMFGHVPVPYSGDINPDGHPNHIGAWGCDEYYADIDSGWTWTDSVVDDTSAAMTRNWNVPHDGKWDQDALYDIAGNDLIELEAGRVDLSNLPAFPLTETQLLRQYINKDHNYKFKLINPPRRALVSDNFQSYNLEYFASTGWRNFAALFNAANVSENDTGYFSQMTAGSYLFSYGCGGGTFTSAAGIGSTSDFASDTVQCVFTMLFGSYFGDWDSQDDFLRAPLACPGWTLTDCWAGRPYWNFHHLGLGETMGYCAKLSENSNNTLYITNPTYPWLGQYAHIGFMGDPSLRLHVVGPPSNLAGTIADSSVFLSWSSANDSILGYYVYRLDTATQIYNRITPSIISSTDFTDNTPLNGKNYYMLRSIKLEKSASGSYYNLSEGIFDTTHIQLTGIPQIVQQHIEMNVYPNPVKENINIRFYLPSSGQTKLTLLNILGIEIKELANSEMNSGEHGFNADVSTLPDGMYYLRLQPTNRPDSFKKIVVTRQ